MGRLPLHTGSARASRQRLVPGQEGVAAKSNEVTATPLPPRRPALAGAWVTTEAGGTREETAQALIGGGAGPVLAPKETWPATGAEVEQVLADPPPGLAPDRCGTVEGGQGRIETRRHAICRCIEWRFSERRDPGEVQVPGLVAAGMTESEAERGGVIGKERRRYLGSGRLDAESFARAARGRGGIGNGPHRVLDVVSGDDRARPRPGHGPATMATVKHAAMNLLTQAKPATSLKNRPKRAGWNQHHPGKVVRRTA